MTTPFSLRIFVADGDPDGLRIVERIGWIGKALMFPRSAWPTVRKRQECDLPGVYLLLGPAESGEGGQLYIGEGDPVKPRLNSHFGEKDFWTSAVFFTATGLLNKAHVQYLESRLIALAASAKRVKLENANTPAESTLSEAERADMDAFLVNLLGLLPILGVTAFVRPQSALTRTNALPASMPERTGNDEAPGRTLLTCKVKGLTATGYDATEGFVVVAGSETAPTATENLIKNYPWVEKTRQSLMERGVLKRDGELLRFTQDYVFTSPSMASTTLLGRPSNGRIDWKDSVTGRTLKELQEAQTKG